MSISYSRTLTVMLPILVSLVLAACADPGSQQKPMADGQTETAVPTTVSTPGPTATAAPVTSQATLPTLTLTHEGRTIEARLFEGCWTPDSSPDLQCVETSPRGEQAHYAEVDGGDTIEIEITPKSRPTRLIASIFTQPGEVMVGNLIHLSPAERELVVDMPPGRYNVRLHAQWFEGGSDIVRHKVNYVFGITVSGEVGLKSECLSTAQGGILGILLESTDDPDRTALDAVNGGGCTFNQEITRVVLILESENMRYVETFRLEPPSLHVSLRLPEGTASERTGGPLAPGLYARKVIAVTADGDEKTMASRAVKLSSGPADPDAPVLLLRHDDASSSLPTSGSQHLEGQLQVRDSCVFIRNGEIPVWPSGFSVSEQDGRIEVLDQHGDVVAREGHSTTLNGQLVGATEPLGLELNRAMPPWCPPGDFWIVYAQP